MTCMRVHVLHACMCAGHQRINVHDQESSNPGAMLADTGNPSTWRLDAVLGRGQHAQVDATLPPSHAFGRGPPQSHS